MPFEPYRSGLKKFPIGVFDSGIGGLTVLEEVLTSDNFTNDTGEPVPDNRPDFEHERFVYLGDQANMPYGNYSSEDKIEFLRELILKDAVFLLGSRYWPSGAHEVPRYDKPPVKAIVIACNTATAYGLEDVKAALEEWSIPVFLVGVVQAGADGAVEALKKQGENGSVAVMATVGTCRSEGYVRAVEKSAREAGMNPPGVIQQGCLGLAGAIEGDASYISLSEAADDAMYRGPAQDNTDAPIEPALTGHYGFEPDGILGNPGSPGTWRLNSVENYIRYHTTTLVERYSRWGESVPISTVILGCTHFPFYTDRITASFERLRSFRNTGGEEPYRNLLAERLTFIDPAELTAVQLYKALAGTNLLLGANDEQATQYDEFYISVPNTSFDSAELTAGGGFSYDYKYGRTPGDFSAEYVKRVPMSRANLSDTVRESIKTSMPAVWHRLVIFSRKSPRTTGGHESF